MLTEEEKRILHKTEKLRKKIRAERIEAGEEDYVEDEAYEYTAFEETQDPAKDAYREGYENAYQRAYHQGYQNGYDSGRGDGAESDFYEEEPTPEKKKKKKHPIRNILLILLFLLLAIFLFILFTVGKTNYEPIEPPIEEKEEWNLPGAGKDLVQNILLIGTDARVVNEDSRSDVIMVVSICPFQHRIYLTSILRDSYVDIPGYGMNRINFAYQMGGAKLLEETIMQNFHIRIDNYAKVDFYSFIEIIDELGGVEITVTPEEVHYVDAYLSEINQLMGIPAQDSFIDREGTYTFNGRQALAYSRIRYIGTDFARTGRQRTVLNAVVDKAKSSPISFVKTVNQVLSNLTTDISDLGMTFLLFRSPFLLTYEVVENQIPEDGLWWNANVPGIGEVLDMDRETIATNFRTKIYGN